MQELKSICNTSVEQFKEMQRARSEEERRDAIVHRRKIAERPSEHGNRHQRRAALAEKRKENA